MKVFWLLLFALSFSKFALAGQKFYVLSTRPVLKTLTQQDLKQIFLGYKKTWPNGDRLRAGHVPAKTPAMQAFIKETLKMTADSYTTYWRRKLFSGRGYPPTKLRTEMELLNFIQSNPNAIAIGDKKIDVDGIRTIDVTSLMIISAN